MMSGETSSSRPVYTKSRSTKSKDRFHGAFKGGFSAGHFNTVGSSKGWNPEQSHPNENSKQKKKPYSKILLDYMDEEDANEWGGPSGLQPSFKHDEESVERNDMSIPDHSIEATLDFKLIRPSGKDSIGKKLLRVLGWREKDGGHIVYVPVDHEQNALDAPIEALMTSNKRIQRIQLKLNQQIQRKLPPPKLNMHGLGFNPYKDAPEFQRHHEKRMKQAQMRALAATTQDGTYRKDVYRTSDIDVPTRDTKNYSTERSQHHPRANVLAYETTDDFIGTKTVGGFALHDDLDDVYDETPSSFLGKRSKTCLRINQNEYDTEISHGSDSDDNDNSDQIKPQSSLHDAFKIWASDVGDTKVDTVLEDGSGVLDGFELGRNSSAPSHRWPGPLVPIDYEIERHVFVPDHRMEYQGANLQSMQKESSSKRKWTNIEKKHDFENYTPKLSMARSHFSSLADTLKNRFVTSSRNDIRDSIPDDNGQKYEDRIVTVVTRTWTTWTPSSLLCKRMNVPVTGRHQTSSATTSLSTDNETREQTFFREEILGKLGPRQENDIVNMSISPPLQVDENYDYERPTMEYMKSIFDTSADSDMSISDEEEGNGDSYNDMISVSFPKGFKTVAEEKAEKKHSKRSKSDEDSSASFYKKRKKKKRKKKHKYESNKFKYK